MSNTQKIYVADHRGMVGADIMREIQQRGLSPDSFVHSTHKELGFTRVQALPNRNLDLTYEDRFHCIVEMDLIVSSDLITIKINHKKVSLINGQNGSYSAKFLEKGFIVLSFSSAGLRPFQI